MDSYYKILKDLHRARYAAALEGRPRAEFAVYVGTEVHRKLMAESHAVQLYLGGLLSLDPTLGGAKLYIVDNLEGYKIHEDRQVLELVRPSGRSEFRFE